MKLTGKRSAGNPHAAFEWAGAGNELTERLVRHSQRKQGATDRSILRSTAPALDPTDLDVGLFEDLAPCKLLQAGDTSQAGDFSGLVANRYFRDVLLAKGYVVI